MFSRFVNFNGRVVDVLDFLIIGFCLASLDQVVGVTYPPDDGCEDTSETRKNAIFKYCDSLTTLYHDIPFWYREILNGEDHCASIRSRCEFNIDIDSL